MGRAPRVERSDLVAQPHVLPHLQRARPPRPDAPRRRPRRPRGGGVPRDGVDRRPLRPRRAAPRAARDVHQHHREARVGLERPRAHRPRRRLRQDPRAGARVRPDALPPQGGPRHPRPDRRRVLVGEGQGDALRSASRTPPRHHRRRPPPRRRRGRRGARRPREVARDEPERADGVAALGRRVRPRVPLERRCGDGGPSARLLSAGGAHAAR